MNKAFENIGIIYNPEIAETLNLAQKLQAKLNNAKLFSLDNLSQEIDLAIGIGGDGTFLKIARYYSKKDIPILGFNVGRLGYLAQAKPSEMDEVVEKIKNNDFLIENRLMLKSNDKIALNDIIIKGANQNRTSTLSLYINEKLLCSYVADGLIISTPTGSTAYSLSAGGPIISPDVDCFLVTPICPHTLNTRPVVIPSNEKITVKILENTQKLNVVFDGQSDLSLDNEVTIEKNNKHAKLIVLNQQKDRFYDILKEKLHWSLAPRK